MEAPSPPKTATPSKTSRRYSVPLPDTYLPEDPQAAREEYVRLRQNVRDSFESFLRNLNLSSLHSLEQEFVKHGGDLNASTFLKVFFKVFPEPQGPRALKLEEKKFVKQMACVMLFEGMDVDQSGEASWMEFVEFVCAIAEELRLQAAEESGQTFEFYSAEQVAVPFRPAITKCHFDRLFFWPEHPIDSAVVFEEGQSGFHLHWPKTLLRRRRIDGHRQELLSAVFLPHPFQWVVTSGNDNMVCFWDENFNLIKRWTLDSVWSGVTGTTTSAGVLCWCHDIRALYAADHFSEKVRAWRISDPMHVRASEGAFKPDKHLDLLKHSTHTKAVQAMVWMSPLQCLATASLDTTVQIFDLVLMKRTHVLSQHKRGLTCLQYCPKNHMLLSGGFDNYINIWDPGAGTLSFTLEGHECSVAGICAMPGTDYEFASVDFDGQVRLWDVRRLVCLQGFSATDRQAEKNGELEPLEPRAICPLGRDRLLISGRRMVVFDREASNPRITADWPINAIAFNQRRIEIVTPIKNDLYVWCALTGTLRTVHDNVIDGTITAITLGLGERRCFIGDDDGAMIVVNYACGAVLKRLQPHAYEVTQITVIPQKIITLSAPEKLIMVHDDTAPDKSVVLKRIDVSSAGTIMQFAHDGKDVIAGASQDWKVVWYHTDFAKEVSNSDGGEVTHHQSVACCSYFKDAPLLVTADAESSVIFWSMPPLRTYSFFSKVKVCFGNSTLPYSISAMALSYPDEEYLYLGVDRGGVACVCIKSILDNAKAQRKEILRRKESGEAAAVISGRIFESMPKPCDSAQYVFAFPNVWLIERAHRGAIDKILVCRRKLPVVLTLGTDVCVRIWSHDKGEALGTLEQGLPEGLSYVRETTWRFPMDAHEEIQHDKEIIATAALEEASSNDEAGDKGEGGRPSFAEAQQDRRAPQQLPPPPQHRRLDASRTVPDLRAIAGAAAGGLPGGRSPTGYSTAPLGRFPRTSTTTTGLGSPLAAQTLDGGKGGWRLQSLTQHRGMQTLGEEWYAGPYAPGHFHNKDGGLPMGLPKLESGMSRPKFSSNKDLVAAARRLSSALGDIDGRNRRGFS